MMDRAGVTPDVVFSEPGRVGAADEDVTLERPSVVETPCDGPPLRRGCSYPIARYLAAARPGMCAC